MKKKSKRYHGYKTVDRFGFMIFEMSSAPWLPLNNQKQFSPLLLLIGKNSMRLNLSCMRVTLPVVTVILLHQGGMWPEHQLYFAGTTINHRVPAPVLSSVIHVQAAVITCLGALNTWTCLLGENGQTHRICMMTKHA